MRQSQKKKGKRPRTNLQPIRNTGERVRRNATCPCGSGKKAKHCCLPRIQAWESIPPERRAEFMTAVILNSGQTETPAEKTIAQLDQVDHAAAESMLPTGDLQSNVGAAVEMMKGEVK